MRHYLYCSLVLLLLSAGVPAADDTVLRDFDISMSQPQCKRMAIGILQSLAADQTPVMEMDHVVSWSSGENELIAVCRADKGLLVLFARGPLTEPAHVRFYEAFGSN